MKDAFRPLDALICFSVLAYARADNMALVLSAGGGGADGEAGGFTVHMLAPEHVVMRGDAHVRGLS